MPNEKPTTRINKIYSDTNVLDAAIARLEFIFAEFDNVCFAFSGGKDSGTLVQLAHIVAKRLGKRFSVFFIDLEAMFQATEDFVKEVRDRIQVTCKNFYWICLPFCEDNATSALNPEFITWEEGAKERWVRPIPAGAITEDNCPFPFVDGISDFNKFVVDFARWLHTKEKAMKTATCIGIRTDESIRRFLAVASHTKEGYKGKKWATQVTPDIYNFYPLYDWRVEDIWGAVAQLDLAYNLAYEAMYKAGVPLSQQRICQPFGQAQKAGLDQFRAIEPETWERLLQRVEGVNFGAIYCRTSLFGHISSMKPDHLTWEQYAVFLLESIGLYEPLIMKRYYSKIKYFMAWGEHNLNIPYGKLPEEGKGDDMCWQLVAKAIERNDFYMSKLSFGYDKAGDQLLLALREKHRLAGDGHLQPKIQQRLSTVEANDHE
jgi:predicted phosphoadenosine phosphosulfate sulfurtransferase